MATVEDALVRIGRLEGAYEHLVTKADLEKAFGDLRGGLRRDLRTLALGLAGLHLLGFGAVAAIMFF